jgi:hypothetical protein
MVPELLAELAVLDAFADAEFSTSSVIAIAKTRR